MKFSYKGRQIRQSKTHDYTHAVVREREDGDIVVWGCMSSLPLAMKRIGDAKRINPDYKIVELERR